MAPDAEVLHGRIAESSRKEYHAFGVVPRDSGVGSSFNTSAMQEKMDLATGEIFFDLKAGAQAPLAGPSFRPPNLSIPGFAYEGSGQLITPSTIMGLPIRGKEYPSGSAGSFVPAKACFSGDSRATSHEGLELVCMPLSAHTSLQVFDPPPSIEDAWGRGTEWADVPKYDACEPKLPVIRLLQPRDELLGELMVYQGEQEKQKAQQEAEENAKFWLGKFPRPPIEHSLLSDHAPDPKDPTAANKRRHEVEHESPVKHLDESPCEADRPPSTPGAKRRCLSSPEAAARSLAIGMELSNRDRMAAVSPTRIGPTACHLPFPLGGDGVVNVRPSWTPPANFLFSSRGFQGKEAEPERCAENEPVCQADEGTQLEREKALHYNRLAGSGILRPHVDCNAAAEEGAGEDSCKETSSWSDALDHFRVGLNSRAPGSSFVSGGGPPPRPLSQPSISLPHTPPFPLQPASRTTHCNPSDVPFTQPILELRRRQEEEEAYVPEQQQVEPGWGAAGYSVRGGNSGETEADWRQRQLLQDLQALMPQHLVQNLMQQQQQSAEEQKQQQQQQREQEEAAEKQQKEEEMRQKQQHIMQWHLRWLRSSAAPQQQQMQGQQQQMQGQQQQMPSQKPLLETLLGNLDNDWSQRRSTCYFDIQEVATSLQQQQHKQ